MSLPTLCTAHAKNLDVRDTRKLTVVQWDAGVLVRGQYEAAATVTQEAAHCVHTFVVTHVAAGVFALINVCVFERD